jgi:hypothetical protein
MGVQLTGWEMTLEPPPSIAATLSAADAALLSAALRKVHAAPNAATATALISKVLRAILNNPSDAKLRCAPRHLAPVPIQIASLSCALTLRPSARVHGLSR